MAIKLLLNFSLKLSELKGSIVILQFTASWCSVCRLEMPHLEEDIWKKYKEKNVVLIGIDRDEPLETVINFKKTDENNVSSCIRSRS